MSKRPSGSKALLNEHQHRALSTRLALLDCELSEARRIIGDDVDGGAMFERVSDLTVEEQEVLRGLLTTAGKIVQELRDRFQLEPRRDDARHWLMGHFSVLWSILHESHADQLNGFGEVSPNLSAQLDPELDQLIEIASRIKIVVAERMKD